MAKASETNKTAAPAQLEKRSYLSQTDVPSCVLDDAIRIAQAIADNYAGKPTSPLNVAAALGMQPRSSRFRQLSGAAIAYGITDGGANASGIAIAPLGKRIIRPTKEGDDVLARREALLRPRVVGQFIRK
jgi:hypothetical protein